MCSNYKYYKLSPDKISDSACRLAQQAFEEEKKEHFVFNQRLTQNRQYRGLKVGFAHKDLSYVVEVLKSARECAELEANKHLKQDKVLKLSE